MVLPGSKAKCLSSVHHTMKTIHHYHHHHHWCKIIISISFFRLFTNFDFRPPSVVKGQKLAQNSLSVRAITLQTNLI